MKRPFNAEEIKILRKGSSPKINESDSALSGCLLFSFLLIAFVVLGITLNTYLSVFWSALLPWPVIGLIYFLFHVAGQKKVTHRFGHALVETVRATNILLSHAAGEYTISVLYQEGEISWAGEITIVYFGDNEEKFRQLLEEKGMNAMSPETGYQMTLDTLFAFSNETMLVRFEPQKQSSAYNLPNGALSDYFRTAYNLVRSEKTGELLFINLDSGTKEYFSNNISFESRNIIYGSYL
ncbi:hypothetical protein F0L74_02350 [Chitinophaga agrisoli]|uniref:Uncharacterized protein n=1 Tax=Chitinophaga agrisoli TaxID=2607653 RepID=A0A5B2W2V5_9BACT|nr:hypothetical protein [Chitinophaga agrisoli]KAA2244827.1 hypothetical protein F0L74_02350 [Chitinophaga agrisoli]